MKEGQVVDTRLDYVMGLASSGSDTLWYAGWDHNMVEHKVQAGLLDGDC